MPRISAFFTDDGVPLTSPSNAPTIRIRRQDTGALVVTDSAMTEQGDGTCCSPVGLSPVPHYPVYLVILLKSSFLLWRVCRA